MTTPIATDSLTLQVSQCNNQGVQGVATPSVNMQSKPDAVEIKEKKAKEPKEKKSLKEKFFNFIASCKKIGVNLTEFTKGGFKAVVKGVVGAGATVGALFGANQVVKGIRTGQGFGVVSEIFKNIQQGVKSNFTKKGIQATLKSTKGIGAIALASAVAIGIGIKTMYDTTLVANQRKHDIDEKYQKTPAIKK